MRKMSPAQQRAYEALSRAEDGTLRDGQGITRTTVEAMERRGIVTVERTMDTREVTYRGGAKGTRTIVRWVARLVLARPTAEQCDELDLIARTGEHTLWDSQRRQVAAYLALTAPKVALPGAPATRPEYDPHAAFASYLTEDNARLIAGWLMFRSLAGEAELPPDPSEKTGKPTDYWVITEPGTPSEPGEELGRVHGATQVDAAIAANALLGRRGGFDMRRLGERELGGWRKDFRTGRAVLRLSATGDGMEQVTLVATGEVMVIRHTPQEAEADARADVAALDAALTR